MLNPSPPPVSLNPAALAFTYPPRSNTARSSFSSSATSSSDTGYNDNSSSASSQGTLLKATTSSISFHPSLPPKEFIPRSQIISPAGMSPPASVPAVTNESITSDDQGSESQFSLGGASIPSDTTLSTNNDLIPVVAGLSKVEDLLLSMKYSPFHYPVMRMAADRTF
jgi:hypothetical protein